MSSKLLDRANRQTTLAAAAGLISFSYLISRLLGLFRDRLLATHFGIGPKMDAYTAAFRLPELLFTLLVSGAFAVAFIPILTEHLVKEEKKEAWELTSSLLNLLVLGTFAIAIVIFIFASPLTTLVTPGFDAYRHTLTVGLTRIMLLTPMFFAISSVLGSVQQAFHRFVIFALASVFYNVGIIFGILYLAPTHSIYGVAWGVVIGAGLQAALQIAGLTGLGYRYSLHLRPQLRSVRRVITLMIPRSIDQGMDQINYLAETIIGSRLATGSLTSYYYANNLKNVPMALIGSAITTATFPKLSEQAAQGEKHQLFGQFARTFRWILFLTLPSAVAAIVLRGYIVRLLFGFGSSVTADTLGWFAGTIIFQSLFFLVARVYYAFQDTRTPLLSSIAAITINVILSFTLSIYMGVQGLALATSISATFETLLLLSILRRRHGDIGQRTISWAAFRMAAAAGVMAITVHYCVKYVFPLYAGDQGFGVVGVKFIILVAIGTVAYLVPSHLLRLSETSSLLKRLRDMMARSLSLN